MKQKTLFDEENRLELLSQLGDPLGQHRTNPTNWEMCTKSIETSCIVK